MLMLTTLTSLTLNQKRAAYKKEWLDKNPRNCWAKHARRDAKRRSEKKGVPFNLSTKYILSILTDFCPVFNTEFVFRGNGRTQPTSPSLDRIDPAKGYVEGNVVVISSKANNIKSAYKSSDIFEVARWLEAIEGMA